MVHQNVVIADFISYLSCSPAFFSIGFLLILLFANFLFDLCIDLRANRQFYGQFKFFISYCMFDRNEIARVIVT